MKSRMSNLVGACVGIMLAGMVLVSGCAYPGIDVKGQVTVEVWGNYADQVQQTGCTTGDKHQCKLGGAAVGTK